MAKACAPKGSLSYAQRKKLPAKAFAQPNLRAFPLYKMSGGKLLPSKSHAVNAKARAKQAYNRGELSKTTLAMIRRKADKVIKECDMAKAKKNSKVKVDRATGRMMAVKLDKRDEEMLRMIQRTIRANEVVQLIDLSAAQKARLNRLMARKLVQNALQRGTYMLTQKGAKAINVKFISKAEVKKRVGAMVKAAKASKKPGGTVPGARRKVSKKKTAKKKASKKKASKKKTSKKTTRTAAQRAATRRLIEMNKKRAKKTAKKKAAKKKKAARKSRAVKARYGPRVNVKVEGSKTRVPVEVRDVKSIRNRVVVLV